MAMASEGRCDGGQRFGAARNIVPETRSDRCCDMADGTFLLALQESKPAVAAHWRRDMTQRYFLCVSTVRTGSRTSCATSLE